MKSGSCVESCAVTGIIIAVIVAILIYIGIAIWTGRVAESKGRSFGAWFCLSFILLGVIALIIAYCLPDNSAYYYKSKSDFAAGYTPHIERKKAGSSTWTCPKCGHVNSADAQNCRMCGEYKK